MDVKSIILLLSGACMYAADPFSYKEIYAIKDFDLVKPEFLTASDGIKLAYYDFVKPKNKEIVILYAGGGLYGNKTYQWVAKTLQENYGIGVYIFDVRGHGNSQGSRGDAPSMERVWQDVAEAVAWVKKNHPNNPLFLVGHSSGAGLIINYAAHAKNKLEDGYIFLAPYLGPQAETARKHENQQTSFIKKARTWVYILGSLFPRSFITHWTAVVFNYSPEVLAADSLIVSSYTYAMSCATSPYEIHALMQLLDKPVGLFIGSDDEQFIPEKVIAYKKLVKAPVYAEIAPGAGHLSILLEAPHLIADYVKKKRIK